MYKLVEQAIVKKTKNSVIIKYRKKVTLPMRPTLVKDLEKLYVGLDDLSFKKLNIPNNYIKALLDNHLLYHYNANFKNTPIERQEYFISQFGDSQEIQKKINNAKILIIGLGGIGSVIIEHLVGMGFKNYVIVDFDKVELSNFNRQFIYNLNDIGKPKTYVINDYIKNRIPDSNVHIHNKKIISPNQISHLIGLYSINIIVNAADSPNIENTIYDGSSGIPIVSGGVGFDIGLSHIITDRNDTDIDSETSNSFFSPQKTIASFGPTNTIIAADMSIKIFNLTTNIKFGNNKSIKIDFFNFNTYNND